MVTRRECINSDTYVNTKLTAIRVMDSLKILVTGSSGFIGTHTVRHLTAAGHKVIGYDLIPPEDKFPDGSIYL